METRPAAMYEEQIGDLSYAGAHATEEACTATVRCVGGTGVEFAVAMATLVALRYRYWIHWGGVRMHRGPSIQPNAVPRRRFSTMQPWVPLHM